MYLLQILLLISIFMVNPPNKRARTKRATPMEAQPIEDDHDEIFESGDEEDEEDDDDSDGSGDEEDDVDPPMPWGEAQWLSMYANHMVNRNIRVERLVKSAVRVKVDNQLSTRNWLGAVNLVNPCYDELVKWFYASAIKNGNRCIVAHVRGKQVVLTPRTIAEITGAPSIANPTYPFVNFDSESKSGKRFLRKILKELTNDKAVSFSSLPHGSLTMDYKFLHVIVTHNLLPVGRFSTVTRERGLLMFSIMNGYSIDLPQLIFDYIASFISVHRRDRDQLPFGTLISKVCTNAGVQIGLADFITPREGPIGFKGYTDPIGSSTAPSSSTSVAGSVNEAWMSRPPSLTPMSACANLDDLIGAMGTFKMEQHAVNQYQNQYLDALYRQRNNNNSP